MYYTVCPPKFSTNEKLFNFSFYEKNSLFIKSSENSNIKLSKLKIVCTVAKVQGGQQIMKLITNPKKKYSFFSIFLYSRNKEMLLRIKSLKPPPFIQVISIFCSRPNFAGITFTRYLKSPLTL